MAIAIILAGGSGIRMGLPTPKQFLQIAGKEIWAHTVTAFQQSSNIHSIILACHRDYIEHMQSCAIKLNFNKISSIVAGGKERYISAFNSINVCTCKPNEKILICDAVRPCITVNVIDRVVEALDVYQACDTGVPVTETLFDVENDTIMAIPDRNRFFFGQGPEGFHYDLLHTALSRYMTEADRTSTNISGIIKHFYPHLEMKCVLGDVKNIKITTATDLSLAQCYLEAAR